MSPCYLSYRILTPKTYLILINLGTMASTTCNFFFLSLSFPKHASFNHNNKPITSLPFSNSFSSHPVSGLKFSRAFAVPSKRPFRVLACDSTKDPHQNFNEDASIDIKLPRRSLLVQFTCGECGERTERLINRLAYERGLVYVQCAGCLQYHKLADNLGLVVEYDLRDEM